MDEKANLMCIAMEYVEHGNMRQYIGELNGKCLIEENDAGLITMQLLQGLYFMHKKGYAHRDIKPAVWFLPSPSVSDVLNICRIFYSTPSLPNLWLR